MIIDMRKLMKQLNEVDVKGWNEDNKEHDSALLYSNIIDIIRHYDDLQEFEGDVVGFDLLEDLKALIVQYDETI